MAKRKSNRRTRPDPSQAPAALAAPTEFLPGTKEKVALMEARVLAGLPATLPGDVELDPAQRREYRRLRNGYDKLEGQAEDRAEPGVKKVVTDGTTFLKDRKRLVFQQGEKLPPLGQRLRDFRRRRGLSRGQVAIETGISKTCLLRLESGERRQPHLCVLWLLADLFKVSLDELVGRGP